MSASAKPVEVPVKNSYEPTGKVGHLEEVGNERTFGRHTEYAEPGHDSGNARDIESLPDHPLKNIATFALAVLCTIRRKEGVVKNNDHSTQNFISPRDARSGLRGFRFMTYSSGSRTMFHQVNLKRTMVAVSPYVLITRSLLDRFLPMPIYPRRFFGNEEQIVGGVGEGQGGGLSLILFQRLVSTILNVRSPLGQLSWAWSWFTAEVHLANYARRKIFRGKCIELALPRKGGEYSPESIANTFVSRVNRPTIRFALHAYFKDDSLLIAIARDKNVWADRCLRMA
ncbi:hypothetical protein EDD18DRAFT_1110364 [Armillaria luteobubalina]|uniref:Uncharacterized protein n=1 Tax=Armillaria luteobubalina TaxID=153913 RepID=A0AA39UI21_9AGAR|nr:hypothetical protein EDD18DRAFT_1110364 [Armillaria luteobubalina]